MRSLSFAPNFIIALLTLAACQESGNAAHPFYGTPTLSDFGDKNYLLNAVSEEADIADAAEVRRLSENLGNAELCTFTLSEEQLYNPYRHLGLRATNWIFEARVLDIDYKMEPTRFSHLKLDYWHKERQIDGSFKISQKTGECFVPKKWQVRSPRIELGVHSFAKTYKDCLRPGLPDPDDFDNCQDGFEIIGGLTHRVKSAALNKHRFRVSWWLKAPDTFEEEQNKIRESLRIPHRIGLDVNSIFAELSENDDYRVRALAFAPANAAELPRYWLISDDLGRNRMFLPIAAPTVGENLEAREKLKAIHRADSVANFSGHYAWDRIARVQKKSDFIPVSRFFDDQTFELWKTLRAGQSLKAFIIFRAKDVDDVYLEEFLLEANGNLTLKKVTQLNAYGMTSLGLPATTDDLDANGLEIYND